MANTVNNIYRNQYKKALRLRGAFEQYWQKYGIPSEGDSVKTVMGTIFNLLQDDLKATTEDEDNNQSVYDRVEFQDLLKLIQQVLGKYLELSKEDLYQSTQPTVSKMKESILQEIKNFLENKLGDKNSYQNVKDEISKEVQKFVDKVRKQKKQELKGKQQELPSKPDDFGSEIVEKVREFLSKNEQPTKKNVETPTSRKKRGEFPKRKDTLESRKPSVDGYGRLKVPPNKKDIAQKIQKSFEKSPIGLVGKKRASGTNGENAKILFKNKYSGVSGYSINAMKMAHDMSMSMFMEINKLDEKNSKKRIQQVEKGTKKVKSGIDKFGSAIMKFMLFPLKILSSIFSPVGKVLKGIVNTILHPIQTIKKLVSSDGWFTSLFVKAMSNPGSAEFLGVLIGGIAGSIYMSLQGVISKYSQPFMDVIIKISNFVHGIIDLAVDFFGRIKDFIRFAFFVFFTKRSNTTFPQRVLMNLANWCGGSISREYASALEKAFNVAKILIGSMRRLNSALNNFSPFLHGFLSGAGVLGILPAIALSGGKILNELFTPTKNGAQNKLNEQTIYDDEDFQYGIEGIVENTSDTLLDDLSNIRDPGIRHSALLRAGGVLDKIKDDVQQIRTCGIMLDQYEGSGLHPDQSLIKQVVASETDILGKGYCSKLFDNIIRQYGKNSFDQLSQSDQIAVLRQILQERLESSRQFITYFRGNNNAEKKAQALGSFISGKTGRGFTVPAIEVMQLGGQDDQKYEISDNYLGITLPKETTIQSQSDSTGNNSQPRWNTIPSWFSGPLSQNKGKITKTDIERKVGQVITFLENPQYEPSKLERTPYFPQVDTSPGDYERAYSTYATSSLEMVFSEGDYYIQYPKIDGVIDKLIKEISSNTKLQEEIRERLVSDLEDAKKMYKAYIIKVGNQGKGDLGGGG